MDIQTHQNNIIQKCQDMGLPEPVASCDGSFEAEIVIIGEANGEAEIRLKRPFAGKSGKLLWDSLRPYGVHRANVYCTNVIKKQLTMSAKTNKKHSLSAEERQAWQQVLYWELSELPNVKYILILGGEALKALTRMDKIMDWRGSIVDYNLPDGRPVQSVLTINPAYAQRELKLEPVFKMDCYKLKLISEGSYKPYVITAHINPTYKQAVDFIRMCKADKKPVSYDIETSNNQTVCHGLANNPYEGMCINLRDHNKQRFTPKEEADILIRLQDLSDTTPFVAQNGNFDTYWTWYKDWLRPHIWFDTLLAHHTLFPQMPHNLGFLTTQYTLHPFYKDELTTWREGGNINQFWEYNVKDCAITLKIQQRLHEELKSQKLEDFFFNHVMRLQPHLARATVNGTLQDVTVREKVIDLCAEDLVKFNLNCQRLAREATNDPTYEYNVNSWQQLQRLFFTDLNLKGVGKSTDKDNRARIIANKATKPIERELIVAIDTYKEEFKFFSSYANSKIDDDNRLRCEYRQFGTTRAPGRLSSASTLWGSGGNLQTIPTRAKEQFIADAGCVFIYFDLSQAEARYVAYVANIEKWKADFERARIDGSYDCHRALAADMWKIDYDLVPDSDVDEDGNKTIRYKAKRCRHGLNYRMFAQTLAEQTGMSYYEALKCYHIYHKETPELKKWWEQEEINFRRNKSAWNSMGRRFKVIQRLDDDVLSSIIAFKPQSTIGDKVNYVWYKSHEDDDWPVGKAEIRLNIHDALIGVATPRYAKTALRIMKKYAEEPIMVKDAWGMSEEPLIIPADCAISKKDETGKHRWSNLVDVQV